MFVTKKELTANKSGDVFDFEREIQPLYYKWSDLNIFYLTKFNCFFLSTCVFKIN